MADATKFYIDGAWVSPHGTEQRDLINPSTEEVIGSVALGDATDVEHAVAAAKKAFPIYSAWSVSERIALLKRINEGLMARITEVSDVISSEMGAPTGISRAAQAPSGLQHFAEIIRVLEQFEFEEKMGSTTIRHEPIGVCALITPWNWPMNQVAVKVAPALAAGCTMVLKPSELAPLDAVILTEIIHEAGTPPGVFNLVHGDGVGVGAPLTAHQDVEMISFTGSTRAGTAIMETAAPMIKRVALELGGKSANIILDDADFKKAIPVSVKGMMLNSGQSCNAQTRLIVPAARYEEVAELAVKAAKEIKIGPPGTDAEIGPIANKAQYGRVLALVEKGIEEGADLLTGGADPVAGLDKGYFVQPTVFGKVDRTMTIAKDEVFGPVLSIMTYTDLDEAIEIANESEYGLSGAVWGADHSKVYEVASRLRTGMVHLNGAGLDASAPFGGYKKSGNGREWGVHGLAEFLEVKSIYGANV